jgi:hypothetical protein
MLSRISSAPALALAVLFSTATLAAAASRDDAYRPPNGDTGSYLGTLPAEGDRYSQSPPDYRSPPPAQGDVYYPPRSSGGGGSTTYGRSASPDYPAPRGDDAYRGDTYRGEPRDSGGPGYGEPYRPPASDRGYGSNDDGPPPPRRDRDYADDRRPSTYSQNEIVDTGHKFFGTVSQGLANVIEYAFKEAGRPNGYILGEDAGGAFVAGLRYGEGTLYTKDAGQHKVFWQGPSVGYDFGAEGSKTMVLVYNLRDISEVYNRYAGVQGSAYVVGGVGIQFQKYGDVVLAPIRSGLGLRLGANVGYLKYTRSPTWNPF